MTDRQARIKALRGKLLALTPEQRQELAARAVIATIEGRTLSLHNTILVYMQANGQTPTVVGGYQQWRKAGRQVKRGEHGYTIWFPVGPKAEDSDNVVASSFMMATVFDIAQTEEA